VTLSKLSRFSRSLLLAGSALGLTTVPMPVVAQEALAEVTAEPDREIIVTAANRTETSLDKVGQSVSVVELAEIERRQTQNVADILRTLPGVTIARNGSIGGNTSVFIRGAESDQTVALIDGIKLNDPSSPGGGFNFGNLMTGNIERIEVLRGSQSVLWGSQAIAGIVNMVTRQPTEELQVNARGEYGFRDTVNLVANASGKAGPLSASVGGGWFRSDGISNFAESRGGRERDPYENIGANANFNLAITDAVSLDARGWYSRGTFNIDGFPAPRFAFADVNEESVTRELVGYTGLNAYRLCPDRHRSSQHGAGWHPGGNLPRPRAQRAARISRDRRHHQGLAGHLWSRAGNLDLLFQQLRGACQPRPGTYLQWLRPGRRDNWRRVHGYRRRTPR
jgi:vitamin B12 transporter